MRKVYEAPVIEKVSFVSDENVCGMFDTFNELFGITVASGGQNFTESSIFQWEALEQNQ